MNDQWRKNVSSDKMPYGYTQILMHWYLICLKYSQWSVGIVCVCVCISSCKQQPLYCVCNLVWCNRLCFTLNQSVSVNYKIAAWARYQCAQLCGCLFLAPFQPLLFASVTCISHLKKSKPSLCEQSYCANIDIKGIMSLPNFSMYCLSLALYWVGCIFLLSTQTSWPLDKFVTKLSRC